MSRLNFDFSGERYCVIGASSGIGKEIALSLARSGAEVLAVGRNKDRLRALHEQNPESIIATSADVTDLFALDLALKNFIQSKGKLKGGVYSAGIFEYTPIRSYAQDVAEQIMRVGFWSAMDFLKLILKPRYTVPSASIVFLSSVAAITNKKGIFAYSAMKSALNSAVKTAAKEIANKGHRINSICPGFVISPMTEEFLVSDTSIEQQHLLGLGKTEDVANATLFLLSDSARWVTGTNLIIDGGYTA